MQLDSIFMALITVFLLVLIFSLIMGNALLFFVRPSKEAVIMQMQESVVSVPVPMVSQAPMEKKIELAHMRIQDIENKTAMMDQKEILLMKKRIEKMDNFCSTAEAEIIGIKEILEEMQNNNITIKARVFKNSSEIKSQKVTPEDLHKLVFRSK